MQESHELAHHCHMLWPNANPLPLREDTSDKSFHWLRWLRFFSNIFIININNNIIIVNNTYLKILYLRFCQSLHVEKPSTISVSTSSGPKRYVQIIKVVWSVILETFILQYYTKLLEWMLFKIAVVQKVLSLCIICLNLPEQFSYEQECHWW